MKSFMFHVKSAISSIALCSAAVLFLAYLALYVAPAMRLAAQHLARLQ